MIKRAMCVLASAVLALGACASLGAAPSQAAFGFGDFDVQVQNEDGSPATQAGSHPFSFVTDVAVNSTVKGGLEFPDGAARTLELEFPPGLALDRGATPFCSSADFILRLHGRSQCPASTVVGLTSVRIAFGPEPVGSTNLVHVPVFNLQPPPGAAAKLGFVVLNVPLMVEGGLSEEPPFNVRARSANIPQITLFYSSKFTLWGNPAASVHDPLRGYGCLGQTATPEPVSLGSCPVNIPKKPLVTLSRACEGPLTTKLAANSWEDPGTFVEASAITHDDSIPPNPQGTTGCGKLDSTAGFEAEPTSDSAEGGTGLDVNVNIDDEGLTSSTGIAQSDIGKAVVTLPEGLTINPSIGEGLGVCTPADIDRERVSTPAGQGCPNASKIGTLLIESPLVDEQINGSVFLAQQDDPTTTTPGAENPFDSLIALYLVLKNQNLGVNVKLPLKVEPDPQTGRLVATIDNIPQVPFSHFNFHFKEGVRAALVNPSTCGTYTTEAKFYLRSDPANPRIVNSDFQVTEGPGGSPCPPGGVPPFHPHFEAGAVNNNAASFSPFNMRLIREDGEQDMTKFSAILPPGELGSLAGVGKCPDSAIGIARSKTGRQELASPSCPANSLIGHTLAGAGVGSALTYVGGQIYLGGPFNGDPLSVISVTPAVAGPFDAGTVVVRLALNLNPKTAEVEVDGANSDPIPHILKGIVLKLRDLRVYVDRPNFTLNPTSCDESSAKSILYGSFLNVLDPADDKPVDLATRYQAANCLNLGFKPKLTLNLKGGSKRGGHPGLRAIYTPKKGDANVEGLVVRLPRSAFLDQAHIKTICTRVQFAAKACPKQSQYGYIKAYTPLLDTPLEGPVYLRSSNHKLPDLVFDLHGLVDVEVATRIDSKGGGIRATVENAPDAPLTKVDLRMQGGKKGLIINSRNLCGHVSKANVLFSGHNGKEFSSKPVMKADCGGKRGRG
jgi:hypothetical protein